MSRIALACVLWASCSAVVASPMARPRVITTVLPVYCVAANVAGDAAEVTCLLGEGGDVHDYQLTPRDRSGIERAQLVLFNGLGLEPWLDRVLASVRDRIPAVELSAGLDRHLLPSLADRRGRSESAGTDSHREHPDSPHGRSNPHLWLDPALMSRMVTNALKAFVRMDPPNAGRYGSNTAVFVQRLTLLDQALAAGLEPFRQTTLVTYHDAFPYFARRYQLNIVGVIEEIPDVDPTPRHLSELRQTIKANRVKAIFIEPRHSARLARQMGLDLNVPVEVLDTLETGELRPDAYERGMRANLETFRRAFR